MNRPIIGQEKLSTTSDATLGTQIARFAALLIGIVCAAWTVSFMFHILPVSITDAGVAWYAFAWFATNVVVTGGATVIIAGFIAFTVANRFLRGLK